MPLVKTGSKKSIGENIKREKEAHPNMNSKQAAAIAYSVARKAGGHFPKGGRHKEHR